MTNYNEEEGAGGDQVLLPYKAQRNVLTIVKHFDGRAPCIHIQWRMRVAIIAGAELVMYRIDAGI